MEKRNNRLIKRRIFDIIQIGNQEDFPSRTFDIVLVVVIIVNIITMFLETFESLSRFQGFFKAVEIITVGIFCIEYVLRIWTAEYLHPGLSRGKAILRFLLSYDGIVDLLTILPFFFLSGFVVFRMLRVVRIFHLFRINTTYDSFHVITSVLYEKRNQIASSVFIIIVLMMASSLCMYSVEHDAQPEVFTNAFSGIWWSMSTLFTVGYGDITPITPLGRFMGIVIAFLGVGAVAIPTGIISAGFVEQYTKLQKGVEEVTAELQVSHIEIDSAWIGKNVTQIEEEYHVDIVLVKRDERTVAPSKHYRVQKGDQVAFVKVSER